MTSESQNIYMQPISATLPLGSKVFWRLSGSIIIAEVTLGALVWILVAATGMTHNLHQGWVMFVAVTFCFCSIVQFFLYGTSVPESLDLPWLLMECVYNILAFSMYLSAAVLLANLCVLLGKQDMLVIMDNYIYGLSVAAVLFAHIVTLLYGISAVISIRRLRFN
ncbi:protein MAL2-like [Lethenteron reissneri]|uniref:protein MAL2-like n=1 Tax=Lethenteron reissneri TaxID=7753 RepID=UPI002AB69254|nr:protein MAL2-like [Lethenteron reissneri]